MANSHSLEYTALVILGTDFLELATRTHFKDWLSEN
jgi:hypothetical protein